MNHLLIVPLKLNILEARDLNVNKNELWNFALVSTKNKYQLMSLCACFWKTKIETKMTTK